MASEYGVPQNRKRAFFVGTKNNKEFVFPTSQIKELISAKEIQQAFGRKDLIFTDQNEIVRRYISRTWNHYTCILMMSSGNFGGIEL